ncbi:unnamed protein product [Symbiodinium natans]|uniref:Uncharacterized protein n=1 Tax=Symbiodinium natans TaxID=878477 RepID=A0A812MX88_9DINO|nr:unnamed protein product [Symbiodinium natans]
MDWSLWRKLASSRSSSSWRSQGTPSDLKLLVGLTTASAACAASAAGENCGICGSAALSMAVCWFRMHKTSSLRILRTSMTEYFKKDCIITGSRSWKAESVSTSSV